MTVGNGNVKWIGAALVTISTGLIVAWIIGIQSDVTQLKVDIAKTANAVDVAAIQGDVKVLNTQIEMANKTLLRIEAEMKERRP